MLTSQFLESFSRAGKRPLDDLAAKEREPIDAFMALTMRISQRHLSATRYLNSVYARVVVQRQCMDRHREFVPAAFHATESARLIDCLDDDRRIIGEHLCRHALPVLSAVLFNRADVAFAVSD
jgi:hypothetical protein